MHHAGPSPATAGRHSAGNTLTHRNNEAGIQIIGARVESNSHAPAPAIVRRVRAWPRRWRLGLLAALTLAALLAVLALPPLPQPQAYHNFADQRGLWGVPHFLNVASNAALVLAGTAGLWFVLAAPGRPKRPAPQGPRRGPYRALGAANEVSLGGLRRGQWSGAGVGAQPWERMPYLVFFLGVLLTGFGSAWYHWMPDNGRLTWDRLPMTLIFMSFLAAAVGERISARAARLGLAPLLALGLASVILWHMGEQRGAGDLRLYGVLQFYAALTIPVIVLLFPSRHGGDRDVLQALGLYALAMLCGELLDVRLFALGQIVSGHTLKHLLAGAAAYRVLRMLTARRG